MIARFIKKNSRSFTTLVALLLIVLVFSIMSPRYFQYDNLIDIVNQGVAVGSTVGSAVGARVGFAGSSSRNWSGEYTGAGVACAAS